MELVASAFVKLKVFALFDCGVKVSEGAVPFTPKLVAPVAFVLAVHSFEALYWTRNCGIEVEVMVWLPVLMMPPAIKLPELSTRNIGVPAAVL